MPDARLHMLISGRVQGVWYRASTRARARELELTGWVRNLAGGRVEALAEGPRSQLDALLAWCHDGPMLARVDDIEATWSEASGEHEGFETRRG
jgi:acylphosphatase